VRQTSSTHGPNGYITTDSDEIAANQNRLMDKLHLAVDRFSFFDAALEDSDTLILTYGVTARAAKVAARQLKRAGRPVSLLVLKTLWPVPENLIRQKAENVGRVVVIEMNLGQYVNEVKRILAEKRVDFYGQMDGRLISPRQIMEVVADDQPAE
jgi:2-oxoglutarate ferredoxin oxidoreductase subunit alpha